MGNNWLNIIQDYLLPPTCVFCGNAGYLQRDLCQPCLQQLPLNQPSCFQCGARLNTADLVGIPCGHCLNQPPAFDHTLAPFIYHGAIRHLITGLKFRADYKNARLLGQLLAHHVQQSTIDKPQLILPIPLHRSRYRERGFNQALEIARTVGQALQLPIDLSSCQRQRDTPHQTGLSAKERRKNLKNAFRLTQAIKADHLVLLDDVMTTGTTVNELARVLKKAGARRVDVWVCART
ncbi:MAG: ComF family protein [Methylococcaceae bacterium]